MTHSDIFSLVLSLNIIIWSHWIADFVFQLDRMARNKSKDNNALMSHIRWYTFILFLGSLLLFKGDFVLAGLFAVVNGIVHYYVDYVTSRMTSKLHAEGKMGSDKFPILGFFAIIGLDQAIHMSTLMTTYLIMVNI